MAGIAIPGQRMIRQSIVPKMVSFMRNWNVAGDWYNNFLYSCVADVGYIKDSLMAYRVHSGNETSESERRLLGITEHYQLINAFVDVADSLGLKKPGERFPKAVKHLGEMCPRYALRMIRDNQFDVARKYLQLSLIFDADMKNNKDYQILNSILQNESADIIRNKTDEIYKDQDLSRNKSYDPPEGYISLEQ